MAQDTTPPVVAAGRATLLPEWRQLATWLVAQREADLRTLAAGLLARGHALLRGLRGAVLGQAPAATTPVPAGCPTGRVPAQRLGARAKPLHLTPGDLPLARQCGYCAAGRRTWAPLDRQLGVDQSGRAPRLVEVLALLGTEVPFAPAAGRLAQLCGVRAGASRVQAVTEAAGRTLAAQQAAQQAAEAARAFAPGGRPPELPPGERRAPWVVVALDGVLVPHRDGHHEGRTGAVAAPRPQDLAAAWPPVPWRYVVHPGEVAAFGQRLWLEAYRQGVEQAQRVLVLGAGAHWIWSLAAEHSPAAVHIVDLWHAVEHLWAAGRAPFGEAAARVAPWVADATKRLREGQVQDPLTEWATLDPKQPEAFAEEAAFFRNQAPRMAYDRYEAQGYPIGSGVVESANRHVVGVRVKQAGMRWQANGVAGVLALRALLRSARWEAWWQAQPPPGPLAAEQ